MSKFSLLAMAAITALTACSAAARTEADASAPVVAASVAPEAAASVVPEAPARVVAEAPRPAPAYVEPASHSSAVSCEVTSRRTANGLLIQARAFADRDISGEYDLVITKSGAAGSSDISQSGALDLTAGSSALLGENEISVERGARVRAVLTLRDDSGQLCRRSFNL